MFASMSRSYRADCFEPPDGVHRGPQPGFTLIELLVVIAIIGILAGLLLPTLITAKIKTQGIQCMNNHRQLALAWKLYSDDNGDTLLFASEDYYGARPDLDPYVWVHGWMSFNPNDPANWDVNHDLARS